MSVLHTVNKSPFERNSLATCLGYGKSGGAILLIEDGVYGALANSAIADKVKHAMGTVEIYALAPDLEARGIKDKVMDGINLVDYSGFVELVAKYDTTSAWL